MKKSVLALALAFGVTTVFAQDLTSKKGEPILPEAGDWSIGVDAGSFLTYAGNFFGKTGDPSTGGGNQAPGFNFLNGNQTIIGKYFTDEKTAYRGILRIGMNSQSTSKDVAQVEPSGYVPPVFPGTYPMVTDKKKYSHNFIGLGGGIEMRKGKTRLQGYYGADAMVWFAGAHDTYTYGNALNSNSGAASGVGLGANTTDFGASSTGAYASNVGGVGTNGEFGGRILKTSGGSTIGVGVRGFIGVEYFILPKMAIGGEFGWGINYTHTSAVTASIEQYAATSGTSFTTASYNNILQQKSSGFSLDTDKNAFGTANAQLRMNFYF